MREELERELKEVKKIEYLQETLVRYVNPVGKWLMYTLPPFLVGLTTLIFLIGTRFLLKLVFYALLGIYGINATFLLLSAWITDRSLRKRLTFERKKGKPIESLDGFEIVLGGVNHVTFLLKIVSLLCYISMVLYVGTLTFGLLELAFAAAGFTLFSFGLAVIIRSLNLKLNDINGLQDFFKPLIHEIKLDNLLSESVANHLDPITYLKWDEFLGALKKILSPTFVEKIQAQEKGETPLTFATEKLLFTYYLLYQDVLTKKQFENEVKEIFDLDALEDPIEKGLVIEGTHYFTKRDIFQIFGYMYQYNPGLFKLIDRLQLEMSENIERLAKDPIYMDACTQEVVYQNDALNIMTFLYNNAPDAKKYTVEIVAPGFEPDRVELAIQVEGSGTFEIPTEKVSLIAPQDRDVTDIMYNMLENGDTLWVTLEPRKVGEQTVQVFLKTVDGTIIEGETKSVQVIKNMKQQLKRITSAGSLLGGIGVAVSRILPVLL